MQSSLARYQPVTHRDWDELYRYRQEAFDRGVIVIRLEDLAGDDFVRQGVLNLCRRQGLDRSWKQPDTGRRADAGLARGRNRC